MKKTICGLNIILLLSIAGFSQKQKTSPDSVNEPLTPVKKQKNSNAEQNDGVLLQSGTSIEAQLQQTPDVKNAAVGNEVVLTTTKSIKQNGQTVVQKGSRLIGRVTEVQQKTKANAQSKLGVVFDRIEGKNLSSPISATLVSITEASANANLNDSVNSDISGSVSRSSQSDGSGGLLGGVTNTLGGVTNTAGQTLGGTTQTLGRTLNGIQLLQSANTSAAGTTTLSSPNKNLRIEKGVMFQLRLNESVGN